MKTLLLTTVAATLAIAAPALAQDYYGGVSYSSTSVDDVDADIGSVTGRFGAKFNPYFGVEGAPTDDLSKFAWSTHKVLPENPTSAKTAAIQGILGDMHTAIMSGSTGVDDAIKEAQDRVANEVG